MDELIELRRTLKSAAESQGIKLSYLPIMVKVRWGFESAAQKVELQSC
jgi:pyruvate/2-oxoglutarate dehydrogenase complex dihydrolipoamide acyltransferase (E2) component